MTRKLLPVVNAKPAASAAESIDEDTTNGAEASVIIWTSVGIVAAFILWLPLAYFAAKLGARMVPELAGAASAEELAARISALPSAAQAALQARVASLQLLAMLVAHAAAGALVAKFGRLTSLRSWTLIGVFTATLAALLTLASGGFSLFALVPIPLAAAGSAGGGWLMRRLGS